MDNVLDVVNLVNNKNSKRKILNKKQIYELNESNYVIIYVAKSHINIIGGNNIEECEFMPHDRYISLHRSGIFEPCDCDCSYSKIIEQLCLKIQFLEFENDYYWTVYLNSTIPQYHFDLLYEDKKYCRGLILCLDYLPSLNNIDMW